MYSSQQQQSSVSEVEEAVEDNLETEVGTNEVQPPGEEECNEGLIGFSRSSQESSSDQSTPAKIKVVPTTATFPFK